MIFVATDWLSISINLLLILFVIISLLMILMVLMQRPKQEGLGAAFGGGMTDQMFGSRTTNVLQRGTVWCASLFFVLALTLAVLIGLKNSRTESLLTTEETGVEESTQVADSEPSEEMIETIRSLIEESPDSEESTEGQTDAVESEPSETETPVEETSSTETETPAEETSSTEEISE